MTKHSAAQLKCDAKKDHYSSYDDLGRKTHVSRGLAGTIARRQKVDRVSCCITSHDQ